MPDQDSGNKEEKKFRREGDLKELQEKFNKFIVDLASDKASGEDIPDIVETMRKEKKNPHPAGLLFSKYKFIIFLVVMAAVLFVPFPMGVNFVGTVVPATRTVIRVPHDGMLKEVNFKYGDTVKKGDLICVIYNERYGLEKSLKEKKLKTALQELDASEKLARDLSVILARKEELSGKALISAIEVDQARLEKDKAEIARLNMLREVKTLKEAIALLESVIQESNIRSQIDGIFMTPNLNENENQFVQKGERLCEIADTGDFVVEISMKEKDMLVIREGQRVSVKFSIHPFRSYAGEISKIGYYVADTLGTKGRTSQPAKDQYYLITFEARTIKTLSAVVTVRNIPKDIKYGMAAKVKATRISNIWNALFPSTA
ncbi:MAG: HlyD family efflux transporter periplasmic adaptor subunit [Candidatus Omnitrophica bacterium]|nr:HlyD family efflux transporter periplasmic adaptor subunit [Candidatus Omnitrophota bacterium]